MGEEGVWALHDVTLPKPPFGFHSFATAASSIIALRFNYWRPGAGSKYLVHEKRNTQENTLQCFTNLYFQIIPYFNYVKVT